MRSKSEMVTAVQKKQLIRERQIDERLEDWGSSIKAGPDEDRKGLADASGDAGKIFVEVSW